MRKAKLFYLPECHSCKLLEDYLDELNEEYRLIVEKYNLEEDNRSNEEIVDAKTEATYYGVVVPPTLIITEANDDDNIIYRFRGTITDKAKQNIFKHLVEEDEEVS